MNIWPVVNQVKGCNLPVTALPTRVGLRIDVDTFSGTRDGVPQLLKILAEHDILATFYFSVGPDNMGRHLWRLLKPRFLLKMLRSNAASLYGWDILLCGTFWPGKNIGDHLAKVMQAARTAGHEIGLHSWDHHKWQKLVETMTKQQIHHEVQKGFDALKKIIGTSPVSSAAAGWKCNEQVLLAKDTFNFRYNSDCRGVSIFRPRIGDHVCAPQIPVTLPTYDELIGSNNISDSNYNAVLLSQIKPGQLNVLTIHAEVEGRSKASLFTDFLNAARQQNITFVPLLALLPDVASIPYGEIESRVTTGREGLVCCQV